MLVPEKVLMSESDSVNPGQPSSLTKSAKVAGIGVKQLVSCWNPAMAILGYAPVSAPLPALRSVGDVAVSLNPVPNR